MNCYLDIFLLLPQAILATLFPGRKEPRVSFVRFVVVHCGEGEWSNTPTPHLLLTVEGRRQNGGALQLLRWVLEGQPTPVAVLSTPLEHARQTRLFLEAGLGLVIVDTGLSAPTLGLNFPYPLGNGLEELLRSANGRTTGEQLCRRSSFVSAEAQRIRREFVRKAGELAAYLRHPTFFIALIVVQDCLPGLLMPAERLMTPSDVMLLDVDAEQGIIIPDNSRLYRVE